MCSITIIFLFVAILFIYLNPMGCLTITSAKVSAATMHNPSPCCPVPYQKRSKPLRVTEASALYLALHPLRVEFEDAAALIPAVQSFDLTNICDCEALIVYSVTSSSPNLHLLAFQNGTEIESEMRLRVRVMYLALGAETVNSTLTLNTSRGTLLYEVRLRAVVNPYGLEPLTGIILSPKASDFGEISSKTVQLFINNRGPQSFLVREIFTTESFLVLQDFPDTRKRPLSAPAMTAVWGNNGPGYEPSTWLVKPGQKSKIISVDIRPTTHELHRGYVHVVAEGVKVVIPVEARISNHADLEAEPKKQVNSSSGLPKGKSQDTELEQEPDVDLSSPGLILYWPLKLEFGTLRSAKESAELRISLAHSGPRAAVAKVLDIKPLQPDSSLSIERSASFVPPSPHPSGNSLESLKDNASPDPALKSFMYANRTVIAVVKYTAASGFSGVAHGTLEVTVEINTTARKVTFQVPYRATVLLGGIGFAQNETLFTLPITNMTLQLTPISAVSDYHFGKFSEDYLDSKLSRPICGAPRSRRKDRRAKLHDDKQLESKGGSSSGASRHVSWRGTERRMLALTNYYGSPVRLTSATVTVCKSSGSVNSGDDDGSADVDFDLPVSLIALADSVDTRPAQEGQPLPPLPLLFRRRLVRRALELGKVKLPIKCTLEVMTNVSMHKVPIHIYDGRLDIVYMNAVRVEDFQSVGLVNNAAWRGAWCQPTVVHNSDVVMLDMGPVLASQPRPLRFILHNRSPVTVPIRFSAASRDLCVCVSSDETAPKAEPWDDHGRRRRGHDLLYETMGLEGLINYPDCVCKMEGEIHRPAFLDQPIYEDGPWAGDQIHNTTVAMLRPNSRVTLNMRVLEGYQGSASSPRAGQQRQRIVTFTLVTPFQQIFFRVTMRPVGGRTHSEVELASSYWLLGRTPATFVHYSTSAQFPRGINPAFGLTAVVVQQCAGSGGPQNPAHTPFIEVRRKTDPAPVQGPTTSWGVTFVITTHNICNWEMWDVDRPVDLQPVINAWSDAALAGNNMFTCMTNLLRRWVPTAKEVLKEVQGMMGPKADAVRRAEMIIEAIKADKLDQAFQDISVLRYLWVRSTVPTSQYDAVRYGDPLAVRKEPQIPETWCTPGNASLCLPPINAHFRTAAGAHVQHISKLGVVLPLTQAPERYFLQLPPVRHDEVCSIYLHARNPYDTPLSFSLREAHRNPRVSARLLAELDQLATSLFGAPRVASAAAFARSISLLEVLTMAGKSPPRMAPIAAPNTSPIQSPVTPYKDTPTIFTSKSSRSKKPGKRRKESNKSRKSGRDALPPATTTVSGRIVSEKNDDDNERKMGQKASSSPPIDAQRVRPSLRLRPSAGFSSDLEKDPFPEYPDRTPAEELSDLSVLIEAEMRCASANSDTDIDALESLRQALEFPFVVHSLSVTERTAMPRQEVLLGPVLFIPSMMPWKKQTDSEVEPDDITEAVAPTARLAGRLPYSRVASSIAVQSALYISNNFTGVDRVEIAALIGSPSLTLKSVLVFNNTESSTVSSSSASIGNGNSSPSNAPAHVSQVSTSGWHASDLSRRAEAEDWTAVGAGIIADTEAGGKSSSIASTVKERPTGIRLQLLNPTDLVKVTVLNEGLVGISVYDLLIGDVGCSMLTLEQPTTASACLDLPRYIPANGTWNFELVGLASCSAPSRIHKFYLRTTSQLVSANSSDSEATSNSPRFVNTAADDLDLEMVLYAEMNDVVLGTVCHGEGMLKKGRGSLLGTNLWRILATILVIVTSWYFLSGPASKGVFVSVADSSTDNTVTLRPKKNKKKITSAFAVQSGLVPSDQPLTLPDTNNLVKSDATLSASNPASKPTRKTSTSKSASISAAPSLLSKPTASKTKLQENSTVSTSIGSSTLTEEFHLSLDSSVPPSILTTKENQDQVVLTSQSPFLALAPVSLLEGGAENVPIVVASKRTKKKTQKERRLSNTGSGTGTGTGEGLNSPRVSNGASAALSASSPPKPESFHTSATTILHEYNDITLDSEYLITTNNGLLVDLAQQHVETIFENGTTIITESIMLSESESGFTETTSLQSKGHFQPPIEESGAESRAIVTLIEHQPPLSTVAESSVESLQSAVYLESSVPEMMAERCCVLPVEIAETTMESGKLGVMREANCIDGSTAQSIFELGVESYTDLSTAPLPVHSTIAFNEQTFHAESSNIHREVDTENYLDEFNEVEGEREFETKNANVDGNDDNFMAGEIGLSEDDDFDDNINHEYAEDLMIGHDSHYDLNYNIDRERGEDGEVDTQDGEDLFVVTELNVGVDRDKGKDERGDEIDCDDFFKGNDLNDDADGDIGVRRKYNKLDDAYGIRESEEECDKLDGENEIERTAEFEGDSMDDDASVLLRLPTGDADGCANLFGSFSQLSQLGGPVDYYQEEDERSGSSYGALDWEALENSTTEGMCTPPMPSPMRPPYVTVATNLDSLPSHLRVRAASYGSDTPGSPLHSLTPPPGFSRHARLTREQQLSGQLTQVHAPPVSIFSSLFAQSPSNSSGIVFDDMPASMSLPTFPNTLHIAPEETEWPFQNSGLNSSIFSSSFVYNAPAASEDATGGLSQLPLGLMQGQGLAHASTASSDSKLTPGPKLERDILQPRLPTPSFNTPRGIQSLPSYDKDKTVSPANDARAHYMNVGQGQAQLTSAAASNSIVGSGSGTTLQTSQSLPQSPHVGSTESALPSLTDLLRGGSGVSTYSVPTAQFEYMITATPVAKVAASAAAAVVLNTLPTPPYREQTMTPPPAQALKQSQLQGQQAQSVPYPNPHYNHQLASWKQHQLQHPQHGQQEYVYPPPQSQLQPKPVSNPLHPYSFTPPGNMYGASTGPGYPLYSPATSMSPQYAHTPPGLGSNQTQPQALSHGQVQGQGTPPMMPISRSSQASPRNHQKYQQPTQSQQIAQGSSQFRSNTGQLGVMPSPSPTLAPGSGLSAGIGQGSKQVYDKLMNRNDGQEGDSV